MVWVCPSLKRLCGPWLSLWRRRGVLMDVSRGALSKRYGWWYSSCGENGLVQKQRIDKEFWRDSAWHPVKLTCFWHSKAPYMHTHTQTHMQTRTHSNPHTYRTHTHTLHTHTYNTVNTVCTYDTHTHTPHTVRASVTAFTSGGDGCGVSETGSFSQGLWRLMRWTYIFFSFITLSKLHTLKEKRERVI